MNKYIRNYDMDSSLLKFFVSVAETGSISAAAKELNYVQSNITARIRQLEEYLGKELFYRKPRGVVLTEAGEKLMVYAKDILRLMDEAEMSVRSMGSFSGRLKIGSTESNAALRLASILGKIHNKYSEIELQLFTGTTFEVKRMLADYEIDIAFISGEPGNSDFEVIKSYAENMVVAEPVEKLESSAILAFRKGCTYRRFFEEYMQSRGVFDYKVMEFGSIETILGCVSAGMGVTYLPEAVVDKYSDIYDLRKRKLPDRYGEITTNLVCRKSSPPLIDIDLILAEI